VLMTIPMELPGTDPNRVSVTFGTILTIGGIMTFLSSLTVGVITDVTGSFLPGFALFSVLAWSLAVAGFLLPETGVAERESGSGGA